MPDAVIPWCTTAAQAFRRLLPKDQHVNASDTVDWHSKEVSRYIASASAYRSCSVASGKTRVTWLGPLDGFEHQAGRRPKEGPAVHATARETSHEIVSPPGTCDLGIPKDETLDVDSEVEDRVLLLRLQGVYHTYIETVASPQKTMMVYTDTNGNKRKPEVTGSVMSCYNACLDINHSARCLESEHIDRH